MRVERIRPAIYGLTLSAYELAALVSAARWVAEGARGELAPSALAQLRQVLASYDRAVAGNQRDDDGRVAVSDQDG